MSMRNVAHPSIDQRRARGGQARERTPLSGHAGWVPAADRPDPVALLEEQNLTREKDLVPVRHGRMMVSPFTFYRGAAKIMAADLKDTPVAGLVRAGGPLRDSPCGPAGVLFQPRPSRSATEATDVNGAGSAALTAASSRLRWLAMAACRCAGSVDSSSSSSPCRRRTTWGASAP